MALIEVERHWQSIALGADGLEVAPCITGPEWTERTQNREGAEMWSVYVHYDGEGAMWIADFEEEGEAIWWAKDLLDHFPNLQGRILYDYQRNTPVEN